MQKIKAKLLLFSLSSKLSCLGTEQVFAADFFIIIAKSRCQSCPEGYYEKIWNCLWDKSLVKYLALCSKIEWLNFKKGIEELSGKFMPFNDSIKASMNISIKKNDVDQLLQGS